MKPIDEIFKNQDDNEQEVEEIELDDVNVITNGTNEDINYDYTFAREKIIKSLVRTSEILDTATIEAKMSPSPRALEAFAAIAKNINDSTDNLIKLHQNYRTVENIKEKEGADKENSSAAPQLSLNDILTGIEDLKNSKTKTNTN